MWPIRGCMALVVIVVHILFIGQSVMGTPTSQQSHDASSQISGMRTGTPEACMERAKKIGSELKRFGVIPGVGWDNLRNTEAGEVVNYTFFDCRTTEDGLFLLPDEVFTIPVKESRVQLFAEIIKHWQNSSSTTANTINADLSAGFGSFSISGKFSREHTELKTHQYRDSAVTIRVQLRYSRYEAKLQPDSRLTSQFKNRLLSIADKIEQEQNKQARYEAQLLVRDFGTHVLTSVTAGAALVKDDYIKRTFAEDTETSTTKLLAAASASFTGWFNFSASLSYSSEVSDSMVNGYSESITQSFIKSYGGPVFTPGLTTLEKWTDGMDMNFVPLDREGQPLNWLINSQTLPEFSPKVVMEVDKIVEQAINTYYGMNAIRGCTKRDAPNFSLAANVDDGTCHPAPKAAAFGGIYRTCSLTGSFISNNPCEGMRQNNPKTGSTACPAGYVAVKILEEAKSSRPESEKYGCERCGFLWLSTCCKTLFHVAKAHVSTYWCAPATKTPVESGYLFGGLFTSVTVNPFTGTMSCPPHYIEFTMSSELSVCACDDPELCAEASVPFGGFFRCDVGNPMATNGSSSSELNWSKGCPSGHSQHLIMNDDGCSLHYCARTGALSSLTLPPVKRPPFMKKPRFIPKNEILDMFEIRTETRLDNDTKEQLTMTVIGKPSEEESMARKAVAAETVLAEDNKWSTEKKTMMALALLKQQQPQTDIVTGNSGKGERGGLRDQGHKLSIVMVAGIAVTATLAFVALVTMTIFAIKHYRRKNHSYGRLSEESTVFRSSYGTANEEA